MAFVHNFSAGPSILPQAVIRQAAEAIRDFNGIGLSILEISHRSAPFEQVMQEAESLVRDLLQVPDSHAVLFLTGGASSQFLMSAMNLLPSDKKACFIDTGTWSAKSIKEAARFGTVDMIASSKEDKYCHIPKQYSIDPEAAYLHITTNNTVYGSQWPEIPASPIPLVADMSSDIFSRTVQIDNYDLIYAGAQKNMGPAGATLVIVRKEALGHTGRELPTMLDYQTHINKSSAFNTPPVYAIYVSMLYLRWMKEQGGVSEMSKRAQQKSDLLYQYIEHSKLFQCTVTAPEDRSRMNATFRIREDAEDLFNKLIAEASISGLKGHRSVGGYRASMYNAMELSSVEHLIGVMEKTSSAYGA